MVLKTKTQLQSEINTNVADNQTGDISAEDVRNILTNINETINNSLSRTLSVSNSVVCGIYPASEKGVKDSWRFNKSAYWYGETRTTGVYLGEFADVTAAAAATGAAIGDYYYDTTSKTYQELTNIGAPASTETFRAGTAEFPARIVILAFSSFITVLDARDGTLWKKIKPAASTTANLSWWRGTDREVSCIDFRNGILAFGLDDTNSANQLGLCLVDFKTSQLYRLYDSAAQNIINDMGQESNDSRLLGSSHDVILSDLIKSVAIGDASKYYGFDECGVPRQFIAIGCDTTHGVSLVHPNGKVYDITEATRAISIVSFNKHEELLIGPYSSGELRGAFDIPFRDGTTRKRRWFSVGAGSTGTPDTFPRIWNTGLGNLHSSTTFFEDKLLSASSTSDVITVIDEDIYGTGDNDGRDSLASYIGYDAALTEHFHSALVDRLCTSAIGTEVGTTNLVENDIVTNGTFASDTGWNKGTGWSIGAGVASCNGTQVADSDIEQDANPTSGQTYYVEFTISNYSAGNVTAIVDGQELTDRSANGTHREAILLTTVDSKTGLRADSNFVGDIDDFRVYKATQDRSQLKTNHAKVNGTITRAAYSSGDVIEHDGGVNTSGTNSGAYWEISYDAFATDGVVFEGWLNHADSSLEFLISNRALSGGEPVVSSLTAGSDGSAIYVSDSDNIIKISNDTGVAVTTTSISQALDAGLHHILIILSSTDFYVYVDGELDKVTSSVTLTSPTDAITYIHPMNLLLPRVGGVDRKSNSDFYRWKYSKERQLFDNSAKCTLQGTGNIIDIAVDEEQKTFTILQTDRYTTFNLDNVVSDNASVSVNTDASVDIYDGDRVIMDGSTLTITTLERGVSNHLLQSTKRLKEKRTFEFDSLVEADPRVFGATISNPPNTSGDTVGGAILDWDGAETNDPSLVDFLGSFFDDEAGSYRTTFTVGAITAGTIAFALSGVTGTARGSNGTYSEVLVYDPAANSNSTLSFNRASSFNGQVSAYRIRKSGVPYWIDNGWRMEMVFEDGSKVRPDTVDLVRDGKITRRFDGKQGWLSTVDTWNTLTIEAVEDA